MYIINSNFSEGMSNVEKRFFDLTNPQKSIWLMEQYCPNISLNNICGNIKIKDKVNFTLLEKALNIYIQKNEAIRFQFCMVAGTPKQYVCEYKPFSIDLVDLANEDALSILNHKIVQTPFTLLDSALYHFTLFRYPDGTGGLNVNFHHLVADAWTMSLFISETMSIYSQLVSNEDVDVSLNPSYLDTIVNETTYLNSDKFEKDSEFWKSEFMFEPKSSSISNFKIIDTETKAFRKTFHLNSDLYESIQGFCKDWNCSIYTFFMVVYSIYIAKINSNPNPIIGTPILNRTNFKDKHTAGMFISTVPFSIPIDFKDTIINLIKSASTKQLSIFRHQKYPYQDLLAHVKKTYNISENLYDVALSYQNAKDDKNSSKIPYETNWVFSGHIVDPLDIHFYDMDDSGSFDIFYDYQISKFDEKDIENIHARIIYIIKQMIQNPNQIVDKILTLTPEECKQMESVFNHSKIAHPYSINVYDLIEQNANQYPEHIAVVDENSKITYQELTEKVDLIAKNLISSGVKKGDCVALLFQKKNIPLICSMLGALKSGAFFLAIYPDYPEDRIQYMLENSKAKLLIAEEYFSSQTFPLQTLYYKKLMPMKADITFPNAIDHDNAYIIYTSGSTGKPKGTVQSHNNLINFVYSFNHYFDHTISSKDRFLSVTNICFDVSISEIFTPLFFGASLYLYPDLNNSSVENLTKYIMDHEITFSYFPPSMLQSIYENLRNYKKVPLNKLLVGVEPIKASILLNYLSLNPNMKIINGYGPSETTICCTMYPFDKKLNPSYITPIGKPIGNSKIHVYNELKQPVPIGEVGEIYVEGECVGNGYLYNPTLTSEKFDLTHHIYRTGDLGRWLSNGNLMFVGRNDNQIKYRGYRIDLGEIEHSIKNIPQIKNTVVLLDKDLENTRLVAFAITNDPAFKEENLRDVLSKTLPHYMIPNQFMFLDKFPLTPNGKIDRKELLSLFANQKFDTYVAPTTDLERTLCQLWSEVLKKEQVGITHNFFDLGGDSLDAIKIATIASQKNIKLSAQSFYNYPTIELLAKHLNTKVTKKTDYLAKIKIKKSKTLPLEGNILLTGVTGFLGAHLLKELLFTTPYKIYCLVRGKSFSDSYHRFIERMHYYFEDSLDKLIEQRVIILNGDFLKEDLGLEPKIYQNLTSTIKTVINSAAIVKHLGNYEMFRKTNIESVENLIRFCETSNHIHLVHISTLSVSGTLNHEHPTYFTEEDLYLGQSISHNIYIKTKFEAEQLLAKKIEDGLNATIFRLGNISWRTNDGKFQINEEDNLFYNVIKFILLTKCLPNSSKSTEINISPVDLCAKLILMILEKNNIYNLYHIYNENTFSLEELVLLLNELGFNIQFVDQKVYQNTIMNLNDSSSLLAKVTEFLKQEESQKNTISISSPYTNKVLNQIHFTWPKLTKDYLQKKIGGSNK